MPKRTAEPWTMIVIRVLAVVGLLLGLSRGAAANCNAIPAPTGTFRGTVGMIDRPFASPGDVITLRPSPLSCPSGAQFPETVDDALVGVVFTPALAGATGTSHLVILAASCDGVDVGQCAAGLWTCIKTTIDRKGDVGGPRIEVPFPMVRQCVGGTHDGETCTSSNECADANGDGHCSDDVADGFTLTGPATIALTTRGNERTLCPLLSAACPAPSGFAACIDAIYSNDDGACSTTPHATFPHFTALPPANDFQAICDPPSASCTGTSDTTRFTIDNEGNLLVPMLWEGIRPHLGVPIARALRLSTTAEAFEGGGASIDLPDKAYLGSYTVQGTKVAPLFDPQRDESARSRGEMTIFGLADAERGILRIARHQAPGTVCTEASCRAHTCVDGPRSGERCAATSECPESECRDGLFDFSGRLRAGTGPIVLRTGACFGGSNPGDVCHNDDRKCPGGQCGRFEATALEPVSLDGIAQTPTMSAFVVPEGIDRKDLNGDRERFRPAEVVMMEDRLTGQRQTLHVPAGCSLDGTASGRAIARVQTPPFSLPALEVAGNVLAFLEAEPLEKACDENRDGDAIDTILRVFQLDPNRTQAREITTSARAVDAAPLLNGRSLVLSHDKATNRTLVYFRTPESGRGRTTARMSVDSRGVGGVGQSTDPVISGTGRFVAFVSDAANLDPDAGTAGGWQLFLHDRDSDDDGIFDEPGAIETTLESGDVPYGARSAVSDDGCSLAFEGYIDTTKIGTAVYLRDRCCGNGRVIAECEPTTVRLSEGLASFPSLSADGKVSVFQECVTVVGSCSLRIDDRRLETPTVDTHLSGREPTISADGNVVVFLQRDADGDNVWAYDRTREKQKPERVSFTRNDLTALYTKKAGVSADGRFIGFNSQVERKTPDHQQFYTGILVRDRHTLRTNGPIGANDLGTFSSPGRALSADGRLLLFGGYFSPETKFSRSGLIDLQTGLADVAVRLPRASDVYGVGVTGLSGDGRFVVYVWQSPTQKSDDPHPQRDVFVQGIDTALDGPGEGTVLQVLDVDAVPEAVTTIGPAGQVAVFDDMAVFLRPDDGEVYFWSKGGALAKPLNLAATSVALSKTWIAALAKDGLVWLRKVNGTAWTNVGQAADAVAISGAIVAFLTPEAAQGNACAGVPGVPGTDLNGDGDCDDRVLQLYDAAKDELLCWPAGKPPAAEELVFGGAEGCELVAFRTPEAAYGPAGVDLNGNGFRDDDILEVYDVGTMTPVNSREIVTPCTLAACDPRQPYRVGTDTVTFLSYLDHTKKDFVLRQLNVRQVAGQCPPENAPACSAANVLVNAPEQARHKLGEVRAGLCRDDGSGGGSVAPRPCTVDEDCTPGYCAAPLQLGSCVRFGPSCDPKACAGVDPGGAGCVCDPSDVCQPDASDPKSGRCKHVGASCTSSAECDVRGDVCEVTTVDLHRLGSPLAVPADGGKVFTSAGRCREKLNLASCPLGTLKVDDACERDHGSCQGNADCPPGVPCVGDLIVATANDADGDEVPDAFDNCPAVPNVDQALSACRSTERLCGNGRVDIGEECDDGNDRDGDACSSTCTLCNPTPRTDCMDAPPGRAKLTMTLHEAQLEGLTWTWRSAAPPPGDLGHPHAADDFGNPLVTARYAFCAYGAAAAGSPSLTLGAAAGSRCPDGPCWKVAGKRGFEFRDRRAFNDGIVGAHLATSKRHAARIVVDGAGPKLTAAPVPDLPLVVQVTNSDTNACWQAEFHAPRRHDAKRLTAVND